MARSSTTWKKGKVAGPGRPKGSQNKLTRLREAFEQSATEDDVIEIMRSMIALAKFRKETRNGREVIVPPEVSAATFVFDRLFGKPKEQVDLTVAEAEITADEESELMAIAERAAHRILQRADDKRDS